jgi:hypothetical protein
MFLIHVQREILETVIDSHNLQVIYRSCNAGACPTIYKDERGSVFIQGNRLGENLLKELQVPDEEAIVELTPELIEAMRKIEL